MGRTSIEYLFSDTPAKKSTGDWAQALRDAKDQYSNCRVVSFTRVKDLNSDWKHEYVQFIVEEESTKDRARVYAERGNEKDLDWVTYGPAETRTTGSKHDGDLPLPLTSFIFGGKTGNDQEQRPTVLQIAEILAAATIVGGGYELFGHSCFWYAYTITDAVERAFGKWASKKSWRWLNIGGMGGGGFKDAWGLGVPMLFKFIYVGDAKKFKEEREVNMNYKFDDREILDPVEVVKSVMADLKSEKNLREYLRTMDLQDEELGIQEVRELLNNSERLAANKPHENANWTKEFEEYNSKLVQRIAADPGGAAYIKYYEDQALGSQSGEGFTGATSDEVTSTELALQVVVGRILEIAQKKDSFR